MWNWFFVPFLSCAFAFPAFATEVHVLSGGAVEPRLVAAADAFRKETGDEVKISFATAPEIRRRVNAGETPDVVIAPPAVLDEITKSGKLDRDARRVSACASIFRCSLESFVRSVHVTSPHSRQ
jgi:ABC-type molybdate transport system substrate-binding protein